MGKLRLPFVKQRALAQLDGLVIIDKFGETVDIDTGDSSREIWDRSHDLTYLSSPSNFFISSSSALDNTEAKLIVLTDKRKYIPLTVTLQGQTPVNINTGSSPDPDFCCNDQKFLRCVRALPANGQAFLGSVYISSDDQNITLGVPINADIQAWVDVNKQQTQMTHFTTPDGYWGLLTSVFVGILNEGNTTASNADIIMHLKHIYGSVFVSKWTLPINTNGGAVFIQGDGRLIKPNFDLHFEVTKVGRNETKIACSFTMELYRQDKINRPIVLD